MKSELYFYVNTEPVFSLLPANTGKDSSGAGTLLPLSIQYFTLNLKLVIKEIFPPSYSPCGELIMECRGLFVEADPPQEVITSGGRTKTM